jgi:hypothetical protein
MRSHSTIPDNHTQADFSQGSQTREPAQYNVVFTVANPINYEAFQEKSIRVT